MNANFQLKAMKLN